VLSACIELTDAAVARGVEISVASEALLLAVYGAARPRLDWVARMPASRRACRLAVILPESDAAQIAAIEQSIRNAFVHSGDDPAARGMKLTIGAAALSATAEQPTALGLLGDAERERRGLTTKLASAVGAVQGTESAASGEQA
jgi:hypothetical protein